MIITCPNCQSRYEVAAQALGERGRKVECASCHANWRALPLPDPVEPEGDQLFSAGEEEALDAAFEAEEQASSGEKRREYDRPATPDRHEQNRADAPPDKERMARQRRALDKRLQVLQRNLPQAKLRRGFRMVMAVVLMTLVGGGIYLREPIVRGLPDLAGVYQAIGLGVNVFGLDFEDVKTLRTLRNGAEVIEINADIANISAVQQAVPPVLVSLTGKDGTSIFEWSVTPQARALQPGDWLAFHTQLTSPPDGATHLRLSFVERPGRTSSK